MKITDLIKKLEDIKEKDGDVPIVVKHDGFGGYGILICDGVIQTTISPWAMAEGGEYGNITDKDIRIFFPNWDGNDDSLDTMDKAKCVCINGGKLIYAS